MKKPLLLLTFLAFSTLSYASHLIGYQASHRCLGNQQYEVKFVIYRDCNSTGASFDDPMEIAVYQHAGGNYLLFSSSQISITEISAPANPGICVEKAVYVKTISLPDDGEYTIVYQRCCLAADIVNIADPANFGLTVTTTIHTGNNICETSPLFSEPPFLTEIYKPYEYIPQLLQPNGDSLSFSFCDIWNGGGPQLNAPAVTSCEGARPTPPCSPPFDSLTYTAPFSAQSPVPADPAFSIDPLTGTISGIPQQIGRYMIGVCIEEFSNGTYIGTSRMAFLLTVGGTIATNEPNSQPAFYLVQTGDELIVNWPERAKKAEGVSLLNANGQVHSTRIIAGNTLAESLPLAGLPSSVMFVKVEWSDGTSSTKPFVKY